MERKENPAAVRSKKALALALADLLTEKDISAITVADITDKAGLSRQTFYTNFSKKEEILQYSLERLFDMYREHLTNRATVRDARETLKDYFSFWYEHRIFLSLLFASKLGYLFFMCNSELFDDALQWLAKEAAASEKEIPYIKEFLAGSTSSLLKTWIVRDKDLSLEELTGLANRMIDRHLF